MSSEVRALGVLALLVLTAVGVAAASHAPTTSGIGVRGAGGVVVTLGSIVVLAGAAMALALLRVAVQTARRRRREDELVIVPERHDTLWQRLGALLMLMVGFGLAVALAFAVGHVHFGTAPGAGPTGARSPAPTATPATPHTSGHGGAGGALIVLAVGAALVAMTIGGYVIARALRRRQYVELDSEQPPDEPTADALRSAAAALATSADPRSAILACYRAMEQRLADAGTARRVADTPEELLDRAALSGLLLPEAAQQLAALFREARFSTHPMTEAHRAEAQSALGAVAQSVGRDRWSGEWW